jgi:hypothetical protein
MMKALGIRTSQVKDPQTKAEYIAYLKGEQGAKDEQSE